MRYLGIAAERVNMVKIVIDPNNAITVVYHKYLVLGHWFMRNDSDSGNIKTAARNKVLEFSPPYK